MLTTRQAAKSPMAPTMMYQKARASSMFFVWKPLDEWECPPMSMSMSILAIVATVRVGASVGSDRSGCVASLVGNVVGAAGLRPFSLRWAVGTRSRARRCSERREVWAGLSEDDGDEGTRPGLSKDQD